ncbi:hypothetical protein ABC974_03620 [Sphingomonas oligophenolica]|uniref:Uncharacterized protein n=1 Tax=Sphingomonas oligophenolica TaxID=301154 RepID=A0ABU9XYU5_9SPHN
MADPPLLFPLSSLFLAVIPLFPAVFPIIFSPAVTSRFRGQFPLFFQSDATGLAVIENSGITARNSGPPCPNSAAGSSNIHEEKERATPS